MLSADESELVYVTAAGEGADRVTGMRMPVGSGIAGWVVQSGQAVALADLTADPRFDRAAAERTGYVPRAVLAVPVAVDDRVLGVLTLLDRDESRPGADRDMALLTAFAEHTALTVDAERSFGELGRVLLAAVGRAAQEGSTLAAALDRASARPAETDDLGELAGLVAQLAEQGEQERRLALALVREVLAYTGRRSPRRSR